MFMVSDDLISCNRISTTRLKRSTTTRHAHTVHQKSPVEHKIALFRSLFRGRDDVYPLRFESRRTGKSGYQPACANEWVPHLCEKPKIKCTACPNQQFLPVTDSVVRWHLSGQDDNGQNFVMGVYPILQDETCFFLAVDFDKLHWTQDAGAFMDTCRTLNLPAALERSRSGQGGHVWLFFDRALPATLARKLGSHILTETMERRPDIGLDSYDRFFPNQDTLPRGGFGNLIALPLQKQPRDVGNSVFIDDQMTAYPDQWAYLSTIRKMSLHEAEGIVHTASEKGRIIGVPFPTTDQDEKEPWAIPPSRKRKDPPINEPLPKKLELIISNDIYIAKDGLPPVLRNRLLRLAAFANPEFFKTQAMRLPTYNKPRIIACGEDYSHHISLPRGCLDNAMQLLKRLKIKPLIQDKRHVGTKLDVTFRGQLRPDQKIAADALLKHETGVLSATTAFGKTVVGIWLTAQRSVNTLILVHRRQLLEQWVQRLATFLGLAPDAIGRIGGGRKNPNGKLDVALIQSLVRKGVVHDEVGQYGHLLVDECHHLPAHSFEQVTRRVKAKYVTGLSATLTRKDGHHPIIFMQCGPVRYHVDAKQQAIDRPFAHTVIVRPTAFEPSTIHSDARSQFQELYNELVTDDARNQLICDDVVRSVHEGRFPVVLTERNEHLDVLASQLSPKLKQLIVLRGGMRKKQLHEILTQIAATTDDDQRVSVVSVSASQRESRKIEQGQNIGERHFVLQGDRENVGICHRTSGVPGEQLDPLVAHHPFGVQPGAIRPLRADAFSVIAKPVENLATEMAHTDRVRVGEPDDHAHLSLIPVGG